MLKNILVGFGLVSIFKYLGSSLADNFLSNISTSISKVEYRFSGLAHLDLDLYFNIQNNNDLGGSADRFEGALYYANQKISSILLDEQIDLLPNAMNEVVVTTRLNLLSLPGTLYDIIMGGQFLGSVRVKGTLFTSYVNLPVDQTVPLIQV